MVTQGLRGVLIPMRSKVVEDDNGAWRDLRDQNFADLGGKSRAVHRTLDDPRCNQRILGQTRDQCLRSPTSKGRVHGQALASSGSATQAGQVGLHCGFINKDNAVWHPGDGGHAMLEPIAALLPYLGATTLARDQRLFCT